MDTLQQAKGLLKVVEGLSRDCLVNRGRQASIPKVAPQGLATLRGGVGLDFHEHLLDYPGWRINSECQSWTPDIPEGSPPTPPTRERG